MSAQTRAGVIHRIQKDAIYFCNLTACTEPLLAMAFGAPAAGLLDLGHLLLSAIHDAIGLALVTNSIDNSATLIQFAAQATATALGKVEVLS